DGCPARPGRCPTARSTASAPGRTTKQGSGKPGRWGRTPPARRAADRAPNPTAVSGGGRPAAGGPRTQLGRYGREAHPLCYGPNFAADRWPRRLRPRTHRGDLEPEVAASHERSRAHRAVLWATTRCWV